MNGRQGKIADLTVVNDSLFDGMKLAIGGVGTQNRPAALVRQLLRSGVKGISLSSMSSSGFDVDLMIAAGVVKQTLLPAVIFDGIGLAPTFRSRVEKGELDAAAVEVTSLMGAYMASAEGLPFHAVSAVRGSDVTALNPLLKPIDCPFTGEQLWAAKALRPDVTFIHAQEADEHGNARVLGASAHGENLLARASARVFLTCDRLVDSSEITSDPMRTTIPGMYVDAVIPLEFAAHPTSSPSRYREDLQHIREYWNRAEAYRRSGDDGELNEYLSRYVYGPKDHEQYLSLVGSDQLQRLSALMEGK